MFYVFQIQFSGIYLSHSSLCKSSTFSVFTLLLFSLNKKTESDRVTKLRRQFHRLERFIENVHRSGRAVIIHGRHAASTHKHKYEGCKNKHINPHKQSSIFRVNDYVPDSYTIAKSCKILNFNTDSIKKNLWLL